MNPQRTLTRGLLVAAALSVLGLQAGARAADVQADFFVATNGNDAWSGRLAAPNAARTDGPFATLTRARDAARGRRGGTVLVRGGTYRLSEPFVLTPADSGTALIVRQT